MKDNEEIWKPVVGYEELYEISSYGRVRSLACPRSGKKHSRRKSERIMKPSYNKANGYYSIALTKDEKMHHFYIHRLVATSFLPNPNNLPEVNHKDENKVNNRVDNLEWCDRMHNIHYGTGMQRRLQNAIQNKRGDNYPKRIAQYTLDGVFVACYYSSEEAARSVGCNGSNIRICARQDKGVKQSNGYIWRYEEEPTLFLFAAS